MPGLGTSHHQRPILSIVIVDLHCLPEERPLFVQRHAIGGMVAKIGAGQRANPPGMGAKTGAVILRHGCFRLHWLPPFENFGHEKGMGQLVDTVELVGPTAGVEQRMVDQLVNGVAQLGATQAAGLQQ